ncbi:MAG: acylphosphatase [Candidatus Micrarchaeaceae archaeon]
MNIELMSAVKIKVHGIVQGVGYRALVMGIAVDLGITGYAKNMADGSVHILAIGEKSKIDKFLKLINVDVEHGPQVHKIDVVSTEESNGCSSFEIG